MNEKVSKSYFNVYAFFKCHYKSHFIFHNFSWHFWVIILRNIFQLCYFKITIKKAQLYELILLTKQGIPC